MKTVFFASFLVFSVMLVTCSSKKAQQRISDYEGILTAQQKYKLDSLYQNHETKTTNQIALITTPGYGEDSGIESYSLHTANRLCIGRKDINNGLLIVVSSSHHQVRISTGLGTEKILTNSYAKKIIDSIMIPKFKIYDYCQGIWDGSKAIIEFLERPENKIR